MWRRGAAGTARGGPRHRGKRPWTATAASSCLPGTDSPSPPAGCPARRSAGARLQNSAYQCEPRRYRSGSRACSAVSIPPRKQLNVDARRPWAHARLNPGRTPPEQGPQRRQSAVQPMAGSAASLTFPCRTLGIYLDAVVPPIVPGGLKQAQAFPVSTMADSVTVTYIPEPDRYEHATYRRCGQSGIDLPVISLGLWQNFGDDTPITTQREIIWRAFDLGVTHFDLANNYGGTAPAQMLGKGGYGEPYGSAETNFGRI